jgi:hypothetical protein
MQILTKGDEHMRIPQTPHQCSNLPCENCGILHYKSYWNSNLCANHEKSTNWAENKVKSKWIETPESSNIAKFRLDGSTLSVVFKAGTQYIYYDVPEEIFEGMKGAESKGKYFNANVKGKFESEKVEV